MHWVVATFAIVFGILFVGRVFGAILG